MHLIPKLRQLADEVAAASEPERVRASWELAGRLLSRLPGDPAEVTRVIDARDAAGLDALVRRLEAPGPAAAARSSAHDDPPVSHDEMQRAMKAYRRRLKLARLDDESKLQGRRLTGGQSSKIVAIQPPHEFPAHVWRALEREGRLRHTGKGFYEEA